MRPKGGGLRMRRGARLVQVHTNDLRGLASADGQAQDAMLHDLAGYIPEQPSSPPSRGMLRASAYLVVVSSPFAKPPMRLAVPMQSRYDEADHEWLARAHPQAWQLRPVGQLVPVAAHQPEPKTPRTVQTLRPLRGGQTYRITSPAARGLVRPALAGALETVFERFAREHGFTPEKPLEIRLARGFKAGSHGHGEGRAADIAAVSGKSLLVWKQEWDQAVMAAEKLPDAQQRAGAIAVEQRCNLGYALYKALQEHSGWRVNQGGWRPYRGVMQLFGPWTATEGPWKAMQIKDPKVYQQQHLADQQWVFRAHRDHIHVAR
jgi:hypothetical protein